jgi:GNAT superfamily N-acetyltransferase
LTDPAIRLARLGDAEALVELVVHLGYPAESERLRSTLSRILERPRQCVLVAATPRVAGWVQVAESDRLASGRMAEIVGLVVEPEQRGSGIGAALVRAAAHWASERGIDRLRVRCNIRRQRAHAFYTDLGFDRSKDQSVLDRALPW